MSEQTQTTQPLLWKPLADKNAEIVKGGGKVTYTDWCPRTGKHVTKTIWVP